jgi:hypothetical protein
MQALSFSAADTQGEILVDCVQRGGAWSCLTSPGNWEQCDLNSSPPPADKQGKLMVAQVGQALKAVRPDLFLNARQTSSTKMAALHTSYKLSTSPLLVPSCAANYLERLALCAASGA